MDVFWVNFEGWFWVVGIVLRELAESVLDGEYLKLMFFGSFQNKFWMAGT